MAPFFDYKALESSGKSQKGLIEAESLKVARLKLKKQGLMVTAIQEKSTKKSNLWEISLFGRVSGSEISLMTRQLASLCKANVPLVEALNALVDQTENERLKVTIAQVRQDVNEGSSLAKATAVHTKIFDKIFVNMIEAGESSGNLSLVLLRLADLKEAQMRLKSKVVSAMTYPALMMLVSFGLMVGIFTFVIPKLTKVFESSNKPIPGLTLFLMGISDLLVHYWPLLFGAMGLSSFLFLRWSKSSSGKPRWDAIKLKIPVLGPLVRMVAVTRFASTMATLLGSGVPILASMSISKNLVQNVPIEQAIAEAESNITEGQSIANPLRKSGEFPAMMIHMIAIGEKTGELPAMLENVAHTYEEQINVKIEAMTSLLEPLMIVGMGGAVGFIVMAVFMPLMELMNVNQR
jgi:general secretion pathway protein F